jgi:hypothetical protein
MGGPGSGPKRERPVPQKDIDELYGGLKKRLVSGDLGAQTELIIRADVLLLREKLSPSKHRGLLLSARVRAGMGAHLSKEKRTKKQAKIVAALDARELDDVSVRDIGPPEDALNPSEDEKDE